MDAVQPASGSADEHRPAFSDRAVRAGVRRSTNLSDTYAWGLWIVFDLVWIAIAAGAFATPGIIYVFQRKDLYAMGRSAVLMGLLSYSFVTVTLIADLGLPWHFYQIGLQAPEHSAMFEVSWCVGLYVSVLLLEFLPVPLQYHGFQKQSMCGGAGLARTLRLPSHCSSICFRAISPMRPRRRFCFRASGLCVPGAQPEG